MDVKFLERRLNDSRFNHFRPIPVAEDIPVETEIFLSEQAHLFPAVVVERQTVRAYPYGSLAAHLLGYVGPLSDEQWAAFDEKNDPDKPYEQADEIGKSGVEATYEQYLRGTPGRQVFEVDSAGRIVRELVDRRVDPLPGDDVHLSIDIRIQYKTEEALAAQLARSGSRATSGATVVVDPRNGQVRAMASWPTYDPAELVGGISQDLWAELTDPETKVLSNRVIQEAYPAASTFKLASSYAALSLGIIEPDVAVADPGTHQLCNPPRNTDGCLKKNSGGGAGHGYITLPTTLTVSSDVYYYKIGEAAYYLSANGDVAEDAFQQEIMKLGYGARTGIDLTGESAGRVPTPESNRQLADSLWERSRDNYGARQGWCVAGRPALEGRLQRRCGHRPVRHVGHAPPVGHGLQRPGQRRRPAVPAVGVEPCGPGQQCGAGRTIRGGHHPHHRLAGLEARLPSRFRRGHPVPSRARPTPPSHPSR